MTLAKKEIENIIADLHNNESNEEEVHLCNFCAIVRDIVCNK